jgi:hypothetical protein
MSDIRDDAAESAFELEVSRLDDRSSAAPKSLQSEPVESSAQSESGPHTETASLRRASGARRVGGLMRAGAVGLIVALAVAVILVSFPAIGERLGGPLTPFAPTATIPPGSDIILLAHTVPWGKVHLERPDLHLVFQGYRSRYPAYRVPPGRHTLFYVAAPFSPMQCALSVPR